MILEEVGIFSENTYSVSIMFAGLICGPIALGPAANFAVISVIVLTGTLKLPYLPPDEQQEWRVEKRSNMLLNERYRNALRLLVGAGSGSGSDPTHGVYNLARQSSVGQHLQQTQTIYAPPAPNMQVTKLHVQEGDTLQPGEPIATLTRAQVAHASQRRSSKELMKEGPQSLKARARMIFDALDDDGNGLLEQSEVVALLLSWGIPQHEALECFRAYDVDDARSVTFEQFYRDWEPVWRFQLGRVDDAVRQFFTFSAQVEERAQLRKQSSIAQQQRRP